MNLEQILERISQIEVELRRDDCDVTALETEYDDLVKQRDAILEAGERRRVMLEHITNDAVPVERIATSPAARQSGEVYTVDSPEYRQAFYKDLAVRGGIRIAREGTDMSAAEQRAFTFLTTNTTALIPTQTQNKMIELVQSTRTLYDDVVVDHFTNQYRVPRHTSIDAGDATVKSENAANADEKDLFDYIPIVGQDIPKHARMSTNMEIQSIDAFESWLVNHIVTRIYHAMNQLLYKQLEATTYGIKAANKLTPEEVTDDVILEALGLIKGDGVTNIYANQATIYTALAVKDEIGRPLYLNNTMDQNPLVAGRAYTASIKCDDALPNNVIWIGKPAEIAANEFEAPNIMQDIDVTNRERVFGGFAKFDALPQRSDCFVKITVTPAAG
ncbi:MAG: phage major capsid protein [Coriobacteriales bacterium]|jgi:HK97 family phage major capsid protein|nr:phage major capsid protein [Coriobacteriales bacterium]